MNCQLYREWIEDAALGAPVGSMDASRRAQLDEHLAACPQCRRAFEAAQKLYTAIDYGIAASVEGMPSGEFAARVRMRLAAESERAQLRWWRRSIWIPALAGAALALLLLTVWIARRPPEHRLQPPKQQTAQTVSPSPEGPAGGQGPGAGGQRPGIRSQRSEARVRGAEARSSRGHGRPAAPDSPPQLQVQVQPGQWAAVRSLYRAGQDGSLKGVTEPSATAEEPLQVKPMEVAPLVIAEIQDPKPVEPEPEKTNVQDR